jgi:tRNA(Ile)-lysidine synthase TilS/MesJ
MLHLMESKGKIEHYYAGTMVGEPIQKCILCGDPSSGDLCQVCRLRQSLGR